LLLGEGVLEGEEEAELEGDWMSGFEFGEEEPKFKRAGGNWLRTARTMESIVIVGLVC
jgi:hypothetical protein